MFVNTNTRSAHEREQLSPDIAFLHRFGIGFPPLHTAQKNAIRFGITSAESLIKSGAISEQDYYRCMAFELELPFVEHSQSSDTPFFRSPKPHALEKMARMVMQNDGSGAIHIAPDGQHLTALKQLLVRNPYLKNRLRVTTQTKNYKALERRGSPSLLQAAISRLQSAFPQFSARQVASARQAVGLFLIFQIVVLFAFFSTGALLTSLHIIAALFYLGCVLLRAKAAIVFDVDARKLPDIPVAVDHSQDHLLPVYTVLVAVYDEANQMSGLINSLLNIDWPHERLEIKIACEADDRATLSVARSVVRQVKTNIVDIVEVPPSEPRTKPKALNYALPLCAGRFLVIYDAEDRPDPLQLREAHAVFVSEDNNLACLQAPLVIHNHHEGWLARLFAIEYSTLFDGLLPMLSSSNAPIPLGGTSNHFKRSVLEKVGAWDPFNVTEDADLGMRFARAGYKISTLRRPTYEEAPVNFMIWRNQRTRWFKGWFQTWLVHMRSPIMMMRELGFRGTLTFHLMITGMIISALIHPILIYFIYAGAIRVTENGIWAALSDPLFLLDLTTVLGGYLTFSALAWRTLPVRHLSHLRKSLWLLPVYWMLLSIAAWRALWQLFTQPHKWEKTPHRLQSG